MTVRTVVTYVCDGCGRQLRAGITQTAGTREPSCLWSEHPNDWQFDPPTDPGGCVLCPTCVVTYGVANDG